ncbi:MAG TPA: helix-turn-helix transcriptional regulator [Candidatus Acidoferrum sp.]|nr:helix-turn-helix transcriptional regulator [Candidatus Acidoferrum sp.]
MPKGNSIRFVLASNLRAIRQKRGLSQEKLGELAGLHRTYIGSVERGERNISIDNVEALARALDTNVTDLLSTKGPR